MDTAGLRAWLQYLRIDKYFEVLSSLGHDAQSLAQLTDAELAALGLPLGPRKKILLNAGLIQQCCRGAPGNVVAARPRGEHGSVPEGASTARRAALLDPDRLTPACIVRGTAGASVASAGNAGTTATARAAAAQPQALWRNQHQQRPGASVAWDAKSGAGVPQPQVLQPRPQPPAHGPQLQAQPKPQLTEPGAACPSPDASSARHALQSNTDPSAFPPCERGHGVPSPAQNQPPGQVHHRCPSGQHQHQPRQWEQRPTCDLRGSSDPWVGVASGGASAGAPGPPPLEHTATGPPRISGAERPQSPRTDFLASSSGFDARLHSEQNEYAERAAKAPCGAPAGGEVACLTAAAAAERRALAQLYPRHQPVHPPPPPPARTFGKPNAGDGAPGKQGALAPRGGAELQATRGGISSAAASEVVGALTAAGGRRSVLKRSRTWDGGDLGNGSRPCLLGHDVSSRGDVRRLGPAPGSCQRPPVARWADSQALYSAAASALPVDCSFRPLRRAAAAAVAAAATGDMGPAAAMNTAQPAAAPGRAGARTAFVVTVEEGPGDDELSGGLARQVQAASVGVNDRIGAGADRGGRLGGGQHQRHHGSVLLDTQRYYNDGRDSLEAVAADAGGSYRGGRLLDDPRNYETPELPAELLHDHDDDVPEAITVVAGQSDEGGLRAAAAALGRDQQAVGVSRCALPQGSVKARAGVAPGRGAGPDPEIVGSVAAWPGGSGAASGRDGDDGGDDDEWVSREQRAARLRALREEVAATEQLLHTLRCMAAAEEAALAAADTGGGRSGGLPDAGGAAPPRDGPLRADPSGAAPVPEHPPRQQQQ